MMKRWLAALLLLCTLAECVPVFAEESALYISEVMTQNGTYKDGEAYDWVEITNRGKANADLSGWYLSDSLDVPMKWAFPEGTRVKAGECVLVYCTGEEMNPGKNGVYYADFKLSSGGDDAVLSAPDGTLQDRLSLPEQYGNITYGIAPDGSVGFFAEQTPGKKNAEDVYPARAKAPVIVTEGGFYDEKVTVICAGGRGQTLRYTLDGATPTENSKEFPAVGLEVAETASLRVIAFEEN